MMNKRTRKRSAGKKSSATKEPGASLTGVSSASSFTDLPSGESGGTFDEFADLMAVNRQMKRKIFDLYTIFEISRTFNAVHDYHSLLDSFVYTCLGQLGAERGAIFLKKDGIENAYYVTEARGSQPLPSQEHYLAADSPLLDYLARLNRPVATAELIGDLASEQESELLKMFKNGLLVPMIYQTRLSGILAISEKISGQSFQPADIEFLSVLSNQIAVAIENARLYEAERMATRQLQSAQQQLLQAERLAALGEMSANVAHEVNNPLGIIKNYLLLIKQISEQSSQTNNYVNIVEQEIDRIAQIVRQLLDFHRPQPQHLAPVNINSLIEQILTFMERPLESNKISLVRELCDSDPIIDGQAESLKQVFLNLAINARDAMTSGGTLTISSQIDNGSVSIFFRDSGPGIAAEHIPHIFEPFFTTKGQGKGTGLGLSVCYGILKQHQGTITYQNVSGGGCFEIRLPLNKDKVTNASNS